MLSKESFQQGLLDNQAEKHQKKVIRCPIGTALLEDFTRFRMILSKSIAKKNQGISLTSECVDESVQRILDRLIFVKKCEDADYEDRKLLPLITSSETQIGQIVKSLRKVFEYYDNFYNSRIFKAHQCDQLEIEDEALAQIIDGLHYNKQRSIHYDFSVIEADVLGNIYEQYLGHLLKKTEKRSKLAESQTHRKEQGIYYTPTFIVDHIVRNTVGTILKDKKVNADKIRVLDLSCGSGSFLIKAFDVFNEYHFKHDQDYDQTKLDFNDEGGTYTKKLSILQNNIFGVDLDKQAVEVAQLNLLLKVAERGKRLPLLQQNIKQGNSLIEQSFEENDRAFDWRQKFPDVMKEGGFDVIIGNPPYVRIQTLDKNQVNYFNSNYASATKNYDIYALFVERGLSLLKEGGILGFILPSKFFNADYGVGLRKLLAEKKYIMKIVNLKDYQVFEGATTYTCLLFLRKLSNKKFEYFELSDNESLERTKTLIPELFKTSTLDQPQDEEVWNFATDDNKELIGKLDKIKLTLGDISSELFVGLQTSADPTYIIEITKEERAHYEIVNRRTKKAYRIEKNIVKKILMGKDIRRWLISWRKLGLIFPCKIENGKAVLIEEAEMKKEFPYAWKYFVDNKPALDLRENGKWKNRQNWHAFVYEKNLSSFSQPKLLTQVLASRNTFTLDETGEYYFVGGGNAGGYGMVLKKEYSKEYFTVLALLNSKLLEFYLQRKSTPFMNGFYSYGKRFIEKLPIIIPKGDSNVKLVELSKAQLKRAKRIAEIGDMLTDERSELEEDQRFADKQINDIIYNMYGITESEQKIIESR